MTKKCPLWFTRPVCLVCVLGFMLVLSACEALPVGVGGGNATPTPPPSVGATQTQLPALPTLTVTTVNSNALLNTNLITNGNAEAGPGTLNSGTVEPVPGWTRHGPLNVILYSPKNANGFIAPTDPGPADRGKNYFWGGSDNAQNLGSSALTSLAQAINLSAATVLFAQGSVHFTLSAWLGGYLGQDDNAKLTIEFISATGQLLNTASVGPVLAAARNNSYGLLERSTDGVVPPGTATVNVTLTITRYDGSDNDGSADDLSLMLHS